jgi:hypothetical protein
LFGILFYVSKNPKASIDRDLHKLGDTLENRFFKGSHETILDSPNFREIITSPFFEIGRFDYLGA